MRITNLETEKIGDQLWRVTSPLVFSELYKGVPEGFVTDGASCPKILWALCAPMSGPQAEAAILHDYLYSKDSRYVYTLRKQADKIFLDAMLADGTPKWKAHLIYWGVRLGGGKSFKACHSKDKLKGVQYGR